MPKQTKKKSAAKKPRAKQKKARKPIAVVQSAVPLEVKSTSAPTETSEPPAPAQNSEPPQATPAEPTATPQPQVSSETLQQQMAPATHPTWYRTLIYGGLSLATLIAIWLCGGIFWSKIIVGSQAVSGSTSNTQLESLVSTQAAAYHITLRYPDGTTHVYPLRTLGFTPDTTASVKAVRLAQRSPKHIFAWWRPVHVSVSMRIDNLTLRNFITENATIVSKVPQNATLVIKDGKAEVVGGKNGVMFGFSNAAGILTQTAENLQVEPLQLTTISRPPMVNEQSLAPVKSKVSTILNQHITVHIGNSDVTPDSKDIANWLTLTPTDTTVEVTLNQDKLQEYINSQATSHSKQPHSQVISDSTGAVISKGATGITVGSASDAVKTIAANVLDAKGASATLPVISTAYKTVRAPTDGKWIEVDLTTKRMYAYDQGDIVHTFLVSAGAAGTPTVTGRFAIYSKYTSQDMFGENADGSHYFQPRVPYINYFYRDYAIHGNYWRPASYFGNINSSHGCVGISVSEGAWMYSWAPIGTPVIVHT